MGNRDDVALCQDCLRRLAVAELVPDDNDPPGLCPCGRRSQTCQCFACIETLETLERGDLQWARRKLKPGSPAIVAWTAEGGATFDGAH